MEIFSCPGCGFRFQSEEKKNCPRCSSAETAAFVKERVIGGSASSGKVGWQEFHSTQTKTCPDCGGVEFDLNWKRKERTCRKCGAVLPLPRRSA